MIALTKEVDGGMYVVVRGAQIKYASSLRRMVAYGGRSIEHATEYRLAKLRLRDYCTEVQVLRA
jgi:hypothetical protein